MARPGETRVRLGRTGHLGEAGEADDATGYLPFASALIERKKRIPFGVPTPVSSS
jgi:hypothetical protein